jgi:hypothetical protein
MNRNAKIVSLLAGGIAFAIIVYLSLKPKEQRIIIQHPLGGQFAGDQQCVSCHSQIHQDFVLTAHMTSTSEATLKTVKGSFEIGKNEILLPRSSKLVMESRDSGLYQIGFQDGKIVKSQRIDVVVGSGTRGQTYLHWEDQKLIQLPVSYNAQEKNWSPVPGSSFNNYKFRRPINAGCLNCHSTHMEIIPSFSQTPEFDRQKSMLGITCERCHGPSQGHVDEMQRNSSSLSFKTKNPRQWNRVQQLDLCAQCHSGIKNQGMPFHFFPGDSLQRSGIIAAKIDTSNTAEVHGNQYDLLSVSKCFLNSEMTCTTCHDPHRNEHGMAELFASKCQSCHQESSDKFCSFKAVESGKLKQNCINCHMPVRASKVITFDSETASKRSAEAVRSHFISINRVEAKKIADFLSNKN